MSGTLAKPPILGELADMQQQAAPASRDVIMDRHDILTLVRDLRRMADSLEAAARDREPPGRGSLRQPLRPTL